MKTLRLGRSTLVSSRLAYGCWRLGGSEGHPPLPSSEPGKLAIHAAVEAGYTLFDLADIYCGGRSEEILGEALRETPGLRARLLLATKCGIRLPDSPAGAPYRYDSSGDHIVASVEGSLRRLGVETIDLLMLHRPDYLMNPHEVAGAFLQLRDAGKVREFGVSNFSPAQVKVLQALCPLPLVVNQVEISLLQPAALENSTLDQCLARQMTPMAWSPLAGGLLGNRVHGLLPSQRLYQPDAALKALHTVAATHGVTRSVIALAWLLKHPAGILPVIGSTNPADIQAAVRAEEIQLTREEWYFLLAAARPAPLP
ncbi:MAG TPA: aldo/keto reductase [Candidatus Limnocylindria bacterium]|jgi:predicted oxidoreductase|nr:aldo/keto reductase [Candidatus Limnocylindria bacterium]